MKLRNGRRGLLEEAAWSVAGIPKTGCSFLFMLIRVSWTPHFSLGQEFGIVLGVTISKCQILTLLMYPYKQTRPARVQTYVDGLKILLSI